MTKRKDLKASEPTQFNTQTILARGWTRTAIKKFLGEPHRHEERYAPGVGKYTLNWYLADDVIAAEGGDGFKDFQARKTARAEPAKKGTQTKYARTLAFAEAMEIHVPKRDLTELRRAACDSFNQRAWARDNNGGASPDSDPQFLDRITVNYIRHEMTIYEAALYAQCGRVGVEDAIETVRRRIYEAIAATYPDLEIECGDQQERREGQKEDFVEGIRRRR